MVGNFDRSGSSAVTPLPVDDFDTRNQIFCGRSRFSSWQVFHNPRYFAPRLGNKNVTWSSAAAPAASSR